MANVSSNQRSDYIFNSATLRNLPFEFVGNSHWDYVAQNDRLKRFLLRNMTRVKASHRQRSARAAQTAKPSQSQSDTSKVVNGHPNTNGIRPNGIPQINGTAKNADSKTTDDQLPEHNTSISALDAMSTQTLLVKHKSDPYDANKRKSLRHLFQKQHEDPNASLVIDLRSIRKKLNWKESKAAQDPPPRKKPRIAPIPCDLYLAIWDNSDTSTSKLPIVSKREFCELTKAKRDADPSRGDVVELKLDEPLIISHKELRVPVRNGKERMALAKEYFMEIKILPRDDHVVWPPIPMLGKSDGDRFNGMGVESTAETDPILIARYQHLPTAPDPDTPLAVFVYAEGTTFRTKYGLEIDAKWVKRDHPDLVRKSSPEPQLESWALDDGRKPFGRVDPTVKPISHAARKSAPVAKKATPKPIKEPKITYSVVVPRGARKEFSRFLVTGYRCYLCPGNPFENLNELRFHLDQNHNNSFFLEDVVVDASDGKLTAAAIRIETPSTQRPKSRQGLQMEDEEKDSIYVAPSVPFDITAHYAGKPTPWSKTLPTQQSKEAAKTVPSQVRASDSQSTLRKENGGHVPYHQVLPFRPQQYQRKKYSNKRLLTKHVSLQNPYTSISHRPIYFDEEEEDARSETDDEVDDTWFVNRHLEELDMHSWQQSWSDARRRLAKRWDWHILHRERGVSAKYLGDCLIRFVRIEKQWLFNQDQRWKEEAARQKAQTENISALLEMMEELKDMKTVNDNVCADVMVMLYADDDLQPPHEEQVQSSREKQALVSRLQDTKERRAPTQRVRRSGDTAFNSDAALPSNVCNGCYLPIEHDNQRAVRCSNLRCSAPNRWYHAKCAGLSLHVVADSDGFESTKASIVHNFMKARLAWKCRKCEDAQEKEKKVLPIPVIARTDTPLKKEDHNMIDAPPVGDLQVEIMVDEAESRSKSPSAAPTTPLSSSPIIPDGDVQDILSLRKVQYAAYVDDRRSLRGIVLHHYHDDGECTYAVLDERPTRSRSKKPHTVLVVIKEDGTREYEYGHRYHVWFTDETKKQDGEVWSFSNRSIEAEIIARFRPYKIQHYIAASKCRTESCNCSMNDPALLEGGCLQLETKRINDCKYSRNTLWKEPGRGFYINEQDDPGTVWYGDYFDELEKLSDLEQKQICKEASHFRCTHSVTTKGSSYKGYGQVGYNFWLRL